MERIIKGRQNGKTTELIKRSAETGIYILTVNHMRAQIIAKQAHDMGYNIPQPVSVSDYMTSHGFRGSHIKKIYIDDADDVLKSIFNTVVIEAITITKEERAEE